MHRVRDLGIRHKRGRRLTFGIGLMPALFDILDIPVLEHEGAEHWTLRIIYLSTWSPVFSYYCYHLC